jgi:uncharacterized protein (DUF1684 family)
MKTSPRFFLAIAVIIILGTLLSVLQTEKEPAFSPGDLLAFRRMKNQALATQVGSPFYRDPAFDSLLYFAPDPSERFVCDLLPSYRKEAFDLLPDYPGIPSHFVAGMVVVKKETWKDTLLVLRDKDEKSDSSFFIPFSDPGNGKETYGGGRYLDVVVKRGKPVVVDFNYAYNPWCAYKSEFVCARIPAENDLSRPVRAGEKDYPARQPAAPGPDSKPGMRESGP